MKNRFTIEIAAPPETVFTYLVDSKRLIEWMPNLVENENLNVTENKIGTTFRHVYDENGQRVEMRGTVTGYEANRRIASDLHGATFDLLTDYELEDLGDGTRLTQEFDIRFKGFFRFVAPILMPLMKRAASHRLEQSFARLKCLAETRR